MSGSTIADSGEYLTSSGVSRSDVIWLAGLAGGKAHWTTKESDAVGHAVSVILSALDIAGETKSARLVREIREEW